MTGDLPGALDDLRVIELCDERGAFAGKLLADMGADVIKVEPPEGDTTRMYEPFVDDQPHPERSLWFWHYNTSKRGITLDLQESYGVELFRQLVASADVLIESQPPGRLAELGLDYESLHPHNEGLIMTSITPFGAAGPRAREEATDLTLLAGGGPAWSCGYDDDALPPVRGGGDQAYHTACHFAVMSTLVAVLHRDSIGGGQHIDVNMHAAQNVTTEAATYHWLVAGETVQRQTGRHAAVQPTIARQVLCRDGRYVSTGLPPRRPEQFQVLYDWLAELELLDEFEWAPILEQATASPPVLMHELDTDDEVVARYTSGIEAMRFLAARMTAYEYFHEGQRRGIQCGVIYSPEEVFEDPHFVARGFPTPVEHPELGETVTYPGAPYHFERTPWRIQRRAPLLGEHNAEVFAALGVDSRELARLRMMGIV